jgi:lysophospholipase L1-like esterase
MAPVDPGAKGADGLVEISSRHPLIRYGGRIDCAATDGPAFAWPGVSIKVRFTGDALDMRFRDFGNGSETATNYYNVIIDNGAPTVLQVSPAQEVYELARNLPAGEHTVEIQKRVESNGGTGKGQLLGLRVREGMGLVPVPASPRKIEFIGDSITCGYGNEVSTMTPDMSHYTSKAENAWLAYGAVTARNLGYEYMAVSYSGRGMYRNYAGGGGDALPGLYLRTLPDEAASPTWDVQRYQPDVVVINLGTNDFSPGGVDRQQYRTAYLNFLIKLRGYYANAAIITAVGPMLSDFYPPGEMAWTNVQADVQTVVQQRKDAGDNRIYYIAFAPQTGPWGEDYHPTVATHADMAAKLTEFIENTVKP